jgi:hypothetical protein
LKLWDQKLLQPGPIEWHHLLAKFHEKNLPSGSKDIHRCFLPKASNAFRSFSSYSKQPVLVATVKITAFMSLLPYSKLHALVAIITSAKNFI